MSNNLTQAERKAFMFKRCYLLFRSQAAKTGFDPKRANNLLRKFAWSGKKGMFDVEPSCFSQVPPLAAGCCPEQETHLVPQQTPCGGKQVLAWVAGLLANAGFETVWPRVSWALLEVKCLRTELFGLGMQPEFPQCFPSNTPLLSLSCWAKQPAAQIQEAVTSLLHLAVPRWGRGLSVP